jgi:hypothetical protein
MTDLKNQLMGLLGDEPSAPDDIERIVGAGRRARRRRQAVIATAGTLGAAGIGAAVAIPLAGNGGTERDTITFATPSSPTPSPSPSASTGKCYLMADKGTGQRTLDRLLKEADIVGKVTSIRKVPTVKGGGRTIVEVCTGGATPEQPQAEENEPPKGPPYNYEEKPAAIAARLESHLHDRVSGFGLSITYTRPFAQESSKLDDGKPSYFGGNVDVHEESGYADIGVQVIHETTDQVPFTGDCTAADKCEETTLADGSVLRTGQVKAGRGDIVVTAEVHRPDGVVVHAQESNYPFGPDAGTQPHGEQPLTLDQLVSLAKDSAFTF